MSDVAYCKIFPPIGIARLGDSTDPDGWFVGPDLDNPRPHQTPGFKFRDLQGHIKRQAARFRIVAFDSNDSALRELTDAEATIHWTVALANKKAAWFEFRGTNAALAVHRGESDVPRPRNFGIGTLTLEGDAPHNRYVPSSDRAEHLEIRPRPCEISGISRATIDDDKGSQFRFVGRFKKVVSVELGELRTDEAGRLLVLGGRGRSDAVDEEGRGIKSERWIRNYANNDDWFDDISDGPVTARVTLRDGNSTVEVRGGAWVIVAPPDFAPDVTNLVTLYDVMEEVALLNSGLVNPTTPTPRTPELVSFVDDIAPLLKRLHSYRWVNSMGLRGHGFGKPGDFQTPGEMDKYLPELSDPQSPQGAQLRSRIFALVREPAYQRGPGTTDRYDTPEAVAQATGIYMPPLAGDEGDPVPGSPTTWLSVSYLQYERLKAWHAGRFRQTSSPATTSATPSLKDRLDRLCQSALGACAGGAFYPGIEMTAIAREPDLYCEAFRLSHERLSAGDVTKYMALPWQADFWECQTHWWPAQRPDDVVTEEQFEQLLRSFTEEVSGTFKQQFDRVLFNRDRWDRGIGRRSRPSLQYIQSRLLPEPGIDSAAEYIELLCARRLPEMDPRFPRFRRADSLVNLLIGVTTLGEFEPLAQAAWPNGQSGERLPSPWRLQFVWQERLDAYAGLYFHVSIPSPDTVLGDSAMSAPVRGCERRDDDGTSTVDVSSETLRSSHLLAGVITSGSSAIPNRNALDAMPAIPPGDVVRREWKALRLQNPQIAARVLGLYASAVANSIVKQVKVCLSEHPASSGTAIALREALIGASVSAIEQSNPQDFDNEDPVFKSLRGLQLIEQLTDLLYLRATNWSGDMDMVNDWQRHGFVVETERIFKVPNEEAHVVAQVERERPKYDGRSFRDYFYYLMNIQEFADFEPYAKRLAETILESAQRLIDETGLFDTSHPESFVEYSREGFGAKLEEIYELLRQQAATADGWRTGRTREEWIRAMLDRAPFNQTDGAWLRFVANAGPSDSVRGLLFQVWSDEVGNGDPSLHHGNLYTTLLTSLGVKLPAVSSRAYADNPDIDESWFIGPVFQLAISLHSEAFFPELLGMTLFLEWEVLSLVPGVKGREYIGIDAQFWRMHVGIDNASHGHGAMARQAVELYLDEVLKDSGEVAMQAEWKRIWRGFVAFATAGYDYFQNKDGQDDLTLTRLHPGTPEDRIKSIVGKKAHYGSLNHLAKRLGNHRMNDLFGDPDVFVDELVHSPWVVPGNPDESKLLSYLTTFRGPMYKVFDERDLIFWRNWIEWLGLEGDTPAVKRYVTKAESMLVLLSELRELARGTEGHRRYRLSSLDAVSKPLSTNRRPTVSDLFERGDLRELMRALKDPENGWIVPFRPAESPIVLDLASAGRAMGRALDRRFVSLGNQIARQVLIKWIEAGCPIPGETAPSKLETLPKPVWRADRLFVQQLGMGAVH